MMKLNGLTAPAGPGMVVEVHLDIMKAPVHFLENIANWGFADDPFLEFFPPQYCHHYTGRTRAVASEMNAVLPQVHEVVDAVIREALLAEVRLYVECELVREIRHFSDRSEIHDTFALEKVSLRKCSKAEVAKADVHVEFETGTVPDDLRQMLIRQGFYWVRTPASERFPSEEIATLQTSTFRDAQSLYDKLVSAPLPGCTGIHLEQKLAMIGSHPNLPLPNVMELFTVV